MLHEAMNREWFQDGRLKQDKGFEERKRDVPGDGIEMIAAGIGSEGERDKLRASSKKHKNVVKTKPLRGTLGPSRVQIYVSESVPEKRQVKYKLVKPPGSLGMESEGAQTWSPKNVELVKD
jgi:hypothetical protein